MNSPGTPSHAFLLQLRQQKEQLEGLVDTLVAGYHSGFAKSIQHYSTILHLFADAKEQVDSLKKSLADASRQLSAQSRHLQQQVKGAAGSPATGNITRRSQGREEGGGGKNGSAALPTCPTEGARRGLHCLAMCRTGHSTWRCTACCLQWRKGVSLESSLKLLDDVAALVDMPAKCEAAMVDKVSCDRMKCSCMLAGPCALICRRRVDLVGP